MSSAPYRVSVAEGSQWVLLTDLDDARRVNDWAWGEDSHPGMWPLRLSLLTRTEVGRPRTVANMPWMGFNVLVFTRRFADSLGEDIFTWGDFKLALVGDDEYLVMRAEETLPEDLWQADDVARYPDGRILAVRSVSFPHPDLLPARPFLLGGYRASELWIPAPIAHRLISHGATGTTFTPASEKREH